MRVKWRINSFYAFCAFYAFYRIMKTFVYLMYATSLRVNNIVPMNDKV